MAVTFWLRTTWDPPPGCGVARWNLRCASQSLLDEPDDEPDVLDGVAGVDDGAGDDDDSDLAFAGFSRESVR